MSYATDGRCHSARPRSDRHECGQIATWIGRRADGFESGFCDTCSEHSYEAKAFISWRHFGADPERKEQEQEGPAR